MRSLWQSVSSIYSRFIANWKSTKLFLYSNYDAICNDDYEGPMSRNLKIKPEFSDHKTIKNPKDVSSLLFDVFASVHIYAGIGENFPNLKTLTIGRASVRKTFKESEDRFCRKSFELSAEPAEFAESRKSPITNQNLQKTIFNFILYSAESAKDKNFQFPPFCRFCKVSRIVEFFCLQNLHKTINFKNCRICGKYSIDSVDCF